MRTPGPSQLCSSSGRVTGMGPWDPTSTGSWNVITELGIHVIGWSILSFFLVLDQGPQRTQIDMEKWSHLPGTSKVPGRFHVCGLELARGCTWSWEIPTVPWLVGWTQAPLTLTARWGCTSELLKGQGLHLGARASNKALSLNGDFLHQDKKVEWKGAPSFIQARLQTPVGGTQLPGWLGAGGLGTVPC